MLQHMPFIRRDFSRIRSDIYPIRLWTVAVFLFAVLPLVRKRGIGRILIGNEYDTTVKAKHEGIPHYDGLYDQSMYFDSALSRYFMRKGWSVSQFSVLRPLSEMLIEKILAERYPQLQQQQVSCHATHEKNGRMYPCGKCEKCRRIVGMLMALDTDPDRCGYSKSQINNCLDQLARRSVSQEDAGKQQLEYMLRERGLIPAQSEHGETGKEHPEILKLRFNSKNSPMATIPPDLRKDLYTIFLQHSNGAVRRKGKTWKSFDPLSDPEINSRYVFEMEPESPGGQMNVSDRPSSGETCLWGELNWQDADERLKQVDIALLAVGAIEQHGPHLPLDTDTFDADYLARRVARACSSPAPLVLPSIAYGVSYHHQDFKGTISIRNDTLSRLVYDIGMSAAQNGIKKLVIINGHGGNSPALNYAAQMINRDAHIFVCVDTGETSDVDIYRLIKTLNDVHAGEFETSTSLATRPHLVKMDRAARSVPEFSSRYLNFTGKRGISWYAYTRKISPLGVMGDPTRADAEKGRKIWEIMIAHLVAFVEDLKNMTLEEIYQKRY
jgi:creatinine amidohydrolase/Fe(II)-dependent formamide hydrolase-like protein